MEERIKLIIKSLYGLKTSAARWHEELSRTLTKLGFFPSRVDSDLWMKDCGTHYEWVDDIIAASKNPSAILRQFITEANYKLKGVGEPTYYLGGDFGRINTTLLPDKKSTCFSPPRPTLNESVRR